ncbi:SIMPL domain-containing protein [Erythrobacter litoralis]|uniref:Outer membrane protein n=1 Tax=Erythrobacter litoralis (strain HTCC2594) TaxID=314225 RepID=Q2N7J3_ERYLH|nr:SIMPL domain-containing protein [Erythrobacter litoralis]ABC64348.1 outer membrane protein [Erythrobacter litoralis HTCC2594]
MRRFLIGSAALSLAACSGSADGSRLDDDETLLSVSASGESDATPDTARFEAGVTSYAGNARAASDANAETVRDVIAALREAGVQESDIQTRALTVSQIEYGNRRGQYQASNIVAVRVRDVAKAGEAVTAATEAGANVVNGPSLSMGDPESAINSAYANAFRAARARADAYAEAAGMEVAQVLRIRDAGGWQGGRMIPQAVVETAADASAVPMPRPVSPPPPEEGAPFMAGTTTSSVSVQVDFALRPL